jgi:methylenetetrahydrofolate reductase (NADPH)
MKVSEILSQAAAKNKTVFSFEIVPPLRGGSVQSIHNAVEPLMEFNPPYINITYHRDEVEYRKMSDGTTKKITTNKRPGSVALAAVLMNRYKVEVVPHIVCAGATQYELENDLIDLNFLGIENVLALRGDPSPSENGIFTPEPNGHRYAAGLVEQIVQMNNGKYLDETLKDAVHTNFCTGVAAYPEKHHEAESMEKDIANLKAKVAAGADYIVTQLFFDNAKFFNFIKLCREASITVPIIPGIKPISTLKHLQMLPQTFHIDIPQELANEVQKSPNNVRQIGVEWAIAQSKELIANGAPAVHYYTMGKSDNIVEIAKKVF